MNKYIEKAQAMVKEFHEAWKKNGEPHPSSNAYLALNRAFFFTKGTENPDTEKVTRFEVIDETGRTIVKYGVEVELSFQDDNRTLKVFLKEKKHEQ